MKLFKLLACALAAAAISSPASAVIFTGSSAAGGVDVTDYSSPGVVSFDLDATALSNATMNFVLEADDLLAPTLSLNALVRNFSGQGIDNASFSLSGIKFAQAGSVTPAFGALGAVSHTDNKASIAFSTPEFAEFHFGNPLGQAGKNDWALDLTGLAAGSAFSITTSVPEPASITMFLTALALFAVARRRKDRG
jgi:hypothetical protein